MRASTRRQAAPSEPNSAQSGNGEHHHRNANRAETRRTTRARQADSRRARSGLSDSNRPIGSQRAMDALSLVVSGSDRDGNPKEISEQVKKAAQAALQQGQSKALAKLPEASAPVRNSSASGLQLTSSGRTQTPSPVVTASPGERAFAESFGAPAKTTSAAPARPTSAGPRDRYPARRPRTPCARRRARALPGGVGACAPHAVLWTGLHGDRC